MLLLEVVGRAEREAPEQTAATAVKVGVSLGFTVIVTVVFGLATHCPELRVKM
jgi:hypothetical protein